MGVFCHACGAELTGGKRFCGRCGTPQTAGAPAPHSGSAQAPPTRPHARLGRPVLRGVVIGATIGTLILAAVGVGYFVLNRNAPGRLTADPGYARDAELGWTVTAPANQLENFDGVDTAPEIGFIGVDHASGTVVVLTFSDTSASMMAGVDLATGELRWKRDVWDEEALQDEHYPAVRWCLDTAWEGRIVCNGMFAVDAASGEPVDLGIPDPTGDESWGPMSPAAVIDGRLVTVRNAHIDATEAKVQAWGPDGEPVWEAQELGHVAGVTGSELVVREDGGSDAMFIDLRTGRAENATIPEGGLAELRDGFLAAGDDGAGSVFSADHERIDGPAPSCLFGASGGDDINPPVTSTAFAGVSVDDIERACATSDRVVASTEDVLLVNPGNELIALPYAGADDEPRWSIRLPSDVWYPVQAGDLLFLVRGESDDKAINLTLVIPDAGS